MVDVVDSKPPLRTRAPPVAEEARVEQVQRSARDAGVRAKDIRRAPQTLATSAVWKAATLFQDMRQHRRCSISNSSIHTCRCDGMVDVVDSKSTAGDSVPVRVRSPAPNKNNPNQIFRIGKGFGLFVFSPVTGKEYYSDPILPLRRLRLILSKSACFQYPTITKDPGRLTWVLLYLFDILEYDYVTVIFLISSTISHITADIFFLNIPSNNLSRFASKLFGNRLHSSEQIRCILFSPGCVISFNAKIISK